MEIKWNRAAIKQLIDALDFIEENEFYSYATEVENNILLRVHGLSQNPTLYPLDKYKK